MISFSYHIEPVWGSLDRIRDGIESSLECFGRKLTDASVMAASELLENAIKYGCPGDKKTGIEFTIIADDHQIRITVSNRIRTVQDYEELKRHIDKISLSDNPDTLFVERLWTLMDVREEDNFAKTRLGLIRIANEGGFELTCKLENNFLTITAVTDLKNRRNGL